MLELLNGKVAIVTGAAGDVGKTIVERCLEEGARVVACDFNGAALESGMSAIHRAAGRLLCVQHDVTSEGDWERAVDAAVERFGRLDTLINCAGITQVFFIGDASLEDWNKTFAVNTTGPFLGMRAALPELRKAAKQDDRGASIVNVASAQGLMAGQPGLCAYAASKGALRLLTRTAAVEFGRLGYDIRCNCVVPSALGGTSLMNSQISTQVERGVFQNLEQGMKVIGNNFPLGRTASPLDVAEAVVFLASDRAKNITGIDLPVDAGRCA